MNRKFLEEQGLEKDQIDSIMKEHGKVVQSAQTQLEAEKEKAKNLQTQITDRDNDIKELKKSSSSNEELTKQLETWETKYEEDTQALGQRLKDQELQSAIKLDVIQSGAKNAKAVIALLETDKLEIEDGKVEEKQLDGLDFVIMIAIAKIDDETKFRKDMYKSKRKELSEIWNGDYYLIYKD